MSAPFEMPPVGCEEVNRFGEVWTDGELDSATGAGMEAHGRVCGQCQDKLDALKLYKQTLQSLAGAEVAPRALEDAIFASPTRERRRRLWGNMGFAAAAAAVSFFSMVGVRSWWDGRAQSVGGADEIASVGSGTGPGIDSDAQEGLESMVVVARQHEALPLDIETRAYDDTQTLNEFFAPRLSFPVQLPQSAVLPVHFAGGRITRFQNGEAAYLKLQSPRGPVSVFVYPRRGGRLRSWPVIRAVGTYSAAQWARDGLTYSAIGEMPDTDLEAVLTAFQEP